VAYLFYQTDPPRSSKPEKELPAMPMTRTCKQPGCSKGVSGAHLLCLDHWHAIPIEIQRQISIRVHGWKDCEAAEAYLSDFLKGVARKAAKA
jgi:hypothetical protein